MTGELSRQSLCPRFGAQFSFLFLHPEPCQSPIYRFFEDKFPKKKWATIVPTPKKTATCLKLKSFAKQNRISWKKKPKKYKFARGAKREAEQAKSQPTEEVECPQAEGARKLLTEEVKSAQAKDCNMRVLQEAMASPFKMPRFVKTIGPKHVQIFQNFIPSFLIFTLAGTLCTAYLCEWKAVLKYVPLWRGRYKASE
ncbi:hypothetical protein JTB14_018786 [Gonioctena quinquepunctata]|nr:hypothetical protein JTB14_018786 [Gonioctena quinquepunctata]